MANRLSQEKASGIAAAYMTNGFKKVEALLSIGYSDTYANNVGLKLFDNDRVKQAIAKIQAQATVEVGFSVTQAQQEYEDARVLSMSINQPSAAVSAVSGKAKLYGLINDSPAVSSDEASPLSDQQRTAAMAAAKAATGPKLSKEAV